MFSKLSTLVVLASTLSLLTLAAPLKGRQDDFAPPACDCAIIPGEFSKRSEDFILPPGWKRQDEFTPPDCECGGSTSAVGGPDGIAARFLKDWKRQSDQTSPGDSQGSGSDQASSGSNSDQGSPPGDSASNGDNGDNQNTSTGGIDENTSSGGIDQNTSSEVGHDDASK